MKCFVELTRTNVTVKQFFKAIEKALDKKGMSFLNIDIESFENTSVNEDSRYHVKDGIKYYAYNFNTVKLFAEETAAQSEIYRTKPYDYQCYLKNFDGSGYNEICEFTFDDEKRGTGYYFQSLF